MPVFSCHAWITSWMTFYNYFQVRWAHIKILVYLMELLGKVAISLLLMVCFDMVSLFNTYGRNLSYDKLENETDLKTCTGILKDILMEMLTYCASITYFYLAVGLICRTNIYIHFFFQDLCIPFILWTFWTQLNISIMITI